MVQPIIKQCIVCFSYADQKPFEMTFLDIPLYNVPEFVIEGTDYYDYLQVLETVRFLLI